MLLSRSAPVEEKKPTKQAKKKKKLPHLHEFLDRRDYVGARTLLEFLEGSGKPHENTKLWLAYCAFHLGDHKKALQIYRQAAEDPNADPALWTYISCCCFYLGMYKESDAAAIKGPKSSLQNRLQFHISHKFDDEKRLLSYHGQLVDCLEDQLTLASIHCMRHHYQEAIEIYKRLLANHPEALALNVYIALCYYKLDYYDVSLEVLSNYKEKDSAVAINLRACNQFRLYNGKAAEAELRNLKEQTTPNFTFAQDLVEHNLSVFREGERANTVFSRLLNVIPEARLNLVIHCLKQNNLDEAHKLIKDIQPNTPNDYILKAIVFATMGQEQDSEELLKAAEHHFQLVGASASECDTIPGRQCMASTFFILEQFDDVLVYLTSIKTYFFNDDTFNFNYGQALASTLKWQEAEEAFLMVQSEDLKSDFIYVSWLARCYIMNKKPRLAWEMYLRMERSNDSFSLLQIIANDCYKMGQFYYSAKAFHTLEALDPNPQFWQGKRGACIGVMQLIMAGKEPKESLREVVAMLSNSNEPEAENIVRIMRVYAKENRIPIMLQ